MAEIESQKKGAFNIPPHLQAGVQSLIDAGESEEFIKEIIAEFSSEDYLPKDVSNKEQKPEQKPLVETPQLEDVFADKNKSLQQEEEPGVAMELVRGLAQGLQRGIDAAGRLIPIPETEIGEKTVTDLTGLMQATTEKFGLPATEYELPTTTTGKITSGFTQTLLGFIPAMKAIKGIGVTNRFIQAIFGGAIGDFVVGDEELAKGMLNVIDMIPAEMGGDTADKIVDVIDDWADDDENGGYDDLKARTINALGGIPIAIAADRVLKVAGIAAESGKETLKRFRDTLHTRLRGTDAPSTLKSTNEQTLSKAHNVISKHVSREGSPRKGAPIFSKIYETFVNKLNPIKKIQRELAEGRELPINLRPYEQARLQVSSMNKANLFLEHEVRNFLTGKVVGPGLRQILKPIANDGVQVRRFSDYAVAKRALELMGRGIKTGFEKNKVELEKVINENAKNFEPIFRNVVEYQNNVLTYLKDSGVLSNKMFSAIKEANKDYVPFFRILDKEGSSGLSKKIFNPIRTIKGSDREIIDPLESIIKNTYVYVQMAERNNVVKTLHDLAKSSKKGADLVKVLPIKSKPISIKNKELEKAIEKADPDSEMLSLLQQFSGKGKLLPDEIEVFRTIGQSNLSNTISYMNKGKRVVLEVDEDVAKALKGMDEESLNIVWRLLSVPATTLRAGAILDPDFFIRNSIRDNVTAAVYSGNGFRPWLVDFISGFNSLRKKDKHFKDWIYGGGAQATLVSMDRQYLRESLSKIIDSGDMYSSVINVVRSPLEILRVSTEFLENSTRLGEFKRAMEPKGKQLELNIPATKEAMQEAAFASREITLDFARRGSGMKGLNMLSAFLNARVQGYDRFARAMYDNPIRTNAKAVMYITAPSIYLWRHNNATPERAKIYNGLPAWQKNLFWIFINDDGDVFRIPKPFELGVLYGSVPERILDAWKGKRKLEDIPLDLLEAMGLDGDSLISSITPTAAQPIIEQATNYSYFKGRSLEPRSLSDPSTAPLAQDRFTLYTSETAKKISMLFGDAGIPVLENLSPIEIENYVTQWTGGLGRKFIEYISDPLGKKLKVFPETIEPEIEGLHSIPFVKAFLIRQPSINSQPITDFFKRKDELMQIVNSFKKREDEADIEGIEKLINLKSNKGLLGLELEKFLTKSQSDISEQFNLISDTYKHPNLSKTEKRLIIDNAMIAMNSIARSSNKVIDTAEQSLKEWKNNIGK